MNSIDSELQIIVMAIASLNNQGICEWFDCLMLRPKLEEVGHMYSKHTANIFTWPVV